ncbi:helix-turn-helix transcriptional regulator [Vibrio sonorensis]|uniref:helix-turn-helix transcriptional regulator n=1 Tax=Vibrio sonorensis TaxID=1004316 RepID=UPI000A7FB44D|nr:AraC family transcriptional regulator [Vibrio sonorensis]
MNFKLEPNKEMLSLVEEVLKYDSELDLMQKMQLELLTQKVLVEIFQQLPPFEALDVMNGKVERANLTTNIEKSLNGLVNYIEANLDKDLSNKELAEYVTTSESNLRRVFRNALGCSIKTYIRHRRLEVARQHLERGVASVTEVAYNAGYKHPSNFTNAFKKAFGYPPAISVNKKG